jgi:N-carbamoylputrescine amidase
MIVPLALVQMAGTGTVEENLDRAMALAREAKAGGARLVCFPELFACPWFARVEDPAGLRFAEAIDGRTVQVARDVARDEGLVLLVSFFERAGDRYYNTAVLLGSDGTTLGTYRKNHIPQARGFYEARYYGPGDLGLPVFDTPLGRIGIQVCSDIMIPEATRVLGLKGADIVLVPRATSAYRLEQWRVVLQAEAVTSGCFVASANRCGREGDLRMGGMSLVAHPEGRVMAEAGQREEIVLAMLDLRQLADYRAAYPMTLAARPELYAEEYAVLARQAGSPHGGGGDPNRDDRAMP